MPHFHNMDWRCSKSFPFSFIVALSLLTPQTQLRVFFYLLRRLNMDYLPIEISTQILSNLPFKSLIRCISVCKTWRSTIDNPKFLLAHFSSSTSLNNPSSFVLIPHSYPGNLCILQDNNLLIKCSNSKISINYPSSFVGFSNGLLCLSSESNSYLSISVSNLSTEESVYLPALSLDDARFIALAYGFSFDPSTEQFYVVVFPVVTPYHRGDIEEFPQLYSSSSRSWKIVEKTIPDFLICGHSQVSLNYSVLWLEREFQQYPFRIVSFDMKNERFEVIPNPPQATFSLDCEDGAYRLELGMLRGCLTLSDCSRGGEIDIWVMKEYNVEETWTKQFVIRNLIVEMIGMNVNPVCFRRNGELVLLCCFSVLVSYNISSGKITRIEDDELPNGALAYPFVRSHFSFR